VKSLLFICVVVFVAGFVRGETEREACERLAPKYEALTEWMLPDRSRVDLLSEKIAWEVDWAPKWAEGIGQAIYYAAWTERAGGLILLVKDPEREKVYVLRAKLACAWAGLTLRVERSVEE